MNKRELKRELEAQEISDIYHYGVYRRGLTSEEIKRYLKIRARTDSKVKKSVKTLAKQFNKVAGINTGAVEFLEDKTPVSLMYRHDVKRFADKLFLGKETYFD